MSEHRHPHASATEPPPAAWSTESHTQRRLCGPSTRLLGPFPLAKVVKDLPPGMGAWPIAIVEARRPSSYTSAANCIVAALATGMLSVAARHSNNPDTINEIADQLCQHEATDVAEMAVLDTTLQPRGPSSVPPAEQLEWVIRRMNSASLLREATVTARWSVVDALPSAPGTTLAIAVAAQMVSTRKRRLVSAVAVRCGHRWATIDVRGDIAQVQKPVLRVIPWKELVDSASSPILRAAPAIPSLAKAYLLLLRPPDHATPRKRRREAEAHALPRRERSDSAAESVTTGDGSDTTGDGTLSPAGEAGEERRELPLLLRSLSIGGGIMSELDRLKQWLEHETDIPPILLLQETGFMAPVDRTSAAVALQDKWCSVWYDDAWDSEVADLSRLEVASDSRPHVSAFAGERYVRRADPTIPCQPIRGVGLIAPKRIVRDMRRLPVTEPFSGVVWTHVLLTSREELILGNAYIPNAQSPSERAHAIRTRWADRVEVEQEVLASEYPHARIYMLGDFNHTRAQMVQFEAESSWNLLEAAGAPETVHTFEASGDTRTWIDHVLVGPGQNETIMHVQDPPETIRAESVFHRMVGTQIWYSEDRQSGDSDGDSTRPPRRKRRRFRKRKKGGKRQRPALPDVSRDAESLGAWGRFAVRINEHLGPMLRSWKTRIFKDQVLGGPQQLMDKMEADLSGTVHQCALSAFGLPPTESVWPWGLQYIPQGPIPQFLPPEWKDLLHKRWTIETRHGIPARPRADDPPLAAVRTRWKRYRSILRQIDAIWRRALQRESHTTSLNLFTVPPRRQWKVVTRLFALEEASTGGETTWRDVRDRDRRSHGNAPGRHVRARDNPARVAPQRSPNTAAQLFRDHWKALLERNPGHEQQSRWCRVDDELFDRAGRPQIDLHPFSAQDWTELRSYVPATVAKGNSNAAITADEYTRAWRKRLAAAAQMAWPEDKQARMLQRAELVDLSEEKRREVELMTEIPSQEVFHEAMDAMDEMLVTCVMAMAHTHRVPREWQRRTLSPVRKPGKPYPRGSEVDDVKAYRPVAWGSQMGGSAFAVVTEWLSARVERAGILSPSQTGFRSHVGAAAAVPLWIAHVASRRALETGQASYLASLDLSNAYDSVPTHSLAETLRRVGIGRNVVGLLSASLCTELAVQVGPARSSPFRANAGVPQGHPSSPLMFAIFFERALRWINRSAQRVRQILDRPEERARIEPSAVAYADDVCLLGRSERETQYLLDAAHRRFTSLGLKVNPTKTQIAVLHRRCLPVAQREPKFHLNGADIELTKVVRVLGTYLDHDLGFHHAHHQVAQQLAVAKAKVLRAARGPPALRLRVYHTIGPGRSMHTLPVISPAASSSTPWWVEGVWRRGLREILGLPPQTSSQFVLWEAGMITLRERAVLLREKLLASATQYPSRAALLHQVMTEQQQYAHGAWHATQLTARESETVRRNAEKVLGTFSSLPQVTESSPRNIREYHTMRWNSWLSRSPDPITEPSRSPLRWLHAASPHTQSVSEGGMPMELTTVPVWLKYAPSGTTASALCAIRAGWYLHSLAVQRLLRERTCGKCRTWTADPRHLAGCPLRAPIWTSFVQRWFRAMAPTTLVERIALLVAESPHRCHTIPIPPDRRSQWRTLFHFEDKRKYWTAVLNLVRLLLSYQDSDTTMEDDTC